MTDAFIVSDVFLNCKESSSIDLITKSSFLTTLLLNEWGLVYHASNVLFIRASLPEEIKRHKQRSFNNKCVGQKTYWFMVWFRNVKKESFSNKFRFLRTESKWISQRDYRCFRVLFPSYAALRDCNFHIIYIVVLKVICVRKKYLRFPKHWDFDMQVYLNEIKSNSQINILHFWKSTFRT